MVVTCSINVAPPTSKHAEFSSLCRGSNWSTVNPFALHSRVEHDWWSICSGALRRREDIKCTTEWSNDSQIKWAFCGHYLLSAVIRAISSRWDNVLSFRSWAVMTIIKERKYTPRASKSNCIDNTTEAITESVGASMCSKCNSHLPA